MKINNDKYYTNVELAKKCFNKVDELLGEEIKYFVEPSAGSGVFLDFLNKKWVAYDIEPEDNRIIKDDFLKLNKKYTEGICFIGNPPFGERMDLAIKFYKKCVKLGDFIAFILPISQLNNTNILYEFDLIYSEDLGEQKYSDRNIHCCFNIYKRPENGINKKKVKKLKDISIYRQDSKKFKDKNTEYDLIMCYWGNGSAGKIYDKEGKYSAEYKIKIHNKDLKNEVIDLLKNIKWEDRLNFVAMKKIQQFHIIDLLCEKINSIK